MFTTKIYSFALLTLFTVGAATADTIVWFEEDFNGGTANWKDRSFLDPTYNAAGGSDGAGYISTTYSFSDLEGAGALLFRGQDEFFASGNAFVGNWIDENVTEVSFNIRHNAPAPVTLGARFSGPGNFPGASAFNFVPVLPNTWTEITIPINPLNPQFITFEGTSFPVVFSLIGHIQITPSTPTGFDTNPAIYTFDLDEVVITAEVPEPATISMIGLMIATCAGRRRCFPNEGA